VIGPGDPELGVEVRQVARRVCQPTERIAEAALGQLHRDEGSDQAGQRVTAPQKYRGHDQADRDPRLSPERRQPGRSGAVWREERHLGPEAHCVVGSEADEEREEEQSQNPD